MGVVILVLTLKLILHNQFIARIPEIPESQLLSETVRQQISEALEVAKRKPSSRNLGVLGMVYHSSANYEQAAQCYELAIDKDGSQWKWNYYLGYLNMELGNPDAVIENFKRVTEKYPDLDLVWYYIGSEYKNLREIELAEESFSKIVIPETRVSSSAETTRIDHFPLSAYAKYQLARIYYDTGRLELAETTLKEIVEDNPSFGPAYRLLGNLYRVEGDLPLSTRYGVRANDLVAFSPPVDTLVDRLVLLSRSELYLLKKIDEAERSIYSQWTLRLVNNAIQYLPDNKYLISKAIKICLWMGLDAQATTYIDRHIDFFRDTPLEIKKTGLSFFLNGLYPQSLRYLNRAMELEPEDLEIQKKLALCKWYLGDKQEAGDMLRTLADKNRNDGEVIAEVAEILFFNFREGERDVDPYLRRAMQLSPSNPKVHKVFAGIAEKNGRIRDAIVQYEYAFRGDPEDLTTIKYLGNMLLDQNLWEKSLWLYREALGTHPNDPYFLERLGTLLIACPDSSLRNIEEGIEYSERAFIHKSSRPNTLVSSGRSLAYGYAKLGDKEEAIDIISQTINIGLREKISPSYQQELQELYETFMQMGN